MRKKLLTLIFLFPLILILFLFSFSFKLLPSLNDIPSKISFSSSYIFLNINEEKVVEVNISPFKEEYLDLISYESLNEDIVQISDDISNNNKISNIKIKGIKEGKSLIKASIKNSSLVSYINVIVLNSLDLSKNGLYVFDDNISYLGINSYLNENPKKARYSLAKDFKNNKVNEVNATFYLDLFDFTLDDTLINNSLVPSKKVKDIEIISGDINISFDEDISKYKVEVLSNDDIEIKFINENKLSYIYKSEVIDDSYYINSYFDLVYLTNHSILNKYKSSPLILNTSLDSVKSSLYYDPTLNEYVNVSKNIKPLLLSKEEVNLLSSLDNNLVNKYHYKEIDLNRYLSNFNTSINYKNNNNSSLFYIEYLRININDINNDDYRFLDRLYSSNNSNDNNKNYNYKSINYLIDLSRSIYGNGYSINFNDFTFPSGNVNYINNNSITSISTYNDIFLGPLKSVGILNSIKKINNKYNGEIDVIESSLYKYKDDNTVILINNLNNYSSSDPLIVSNLIIKGCDDKSTLNEYRYIGNLISIYNSSNILFEDLNLSNSRNLIYQSSSSNITLSNSLLMHSYDNLIKLSSSTYKAFLNMEDSLSYQFIEDKDDKINESNIDNTLTIKNNIFYQSGFASIFIDNHLNGSLLYNSSFNEYFSSSLPLGGVSKGSRLIMDGNNYFYDFKKLEDLNINSIFESDNSSFSNILESFNVSSLLDNEFNKDENKVYLYDENYISTPIISLGGGTNFSKVDLNDESINRLYSFKGEDGIKVEESSIFYMIFGNGNFKFYLYKNDESSLIKPTSSLDLSLIRY